MGGSYSTNTSPSSSVALRSQTTISANYWNRETSKPKSYSTSEPIVQKAKIISLSIDDDANTALHKEELPDGAELVAIVGDDTIDEKLEELKALEPNVIFVSHPKAREPLAKLIQEIPSIQWIHTRSAGIDFVFSETLASDTTSMIQMTNSKGCYSSTLAEYTMMACSYFAKDLPRLMRQKKEKNWEKYSVEEIRGKTMGIIGYGDIGRACAKLAKAYGMNVIALRRNPEYCNDDPFCDAAYGNDKDSLHQLMQNSDYILVSAPLTTDTKGMVDAKAFSCAKENAVVINVGRGPIIDEEALIEVLKASKIRGAALDVFSTEPLPVDSELWGLDNVLMSPHNMDQTDTFQHEATAFFLEENLPRFLRGLQLINLVDKKSGY